MVLQNRSWLEPAVDVQDGAMEGRIGQRHMCMFSTLLFFFFKGEQRQRQSGGRGKRAAAVIMQR